MNRKMFLGFALIACISLGLLSGAVQTQVTTKAQIAFASNRDGNWEIYVMDVDGKNLRIFTNHPAFGRHPDWFDPTALSVSSAGKHITIWGWIKKP